MAEKILLLAANPAYQPRPSLDREAQEIESRFRHSRSRLEIKQQWITQPQDLRRALLEHKPQVVHFCGHGAGSDGVVLDGHLVDADALAGLLGLFSANIKCVLLEACYSDVQAQAIAKRIDFVVGIHAAIGESAAIEFVSAFYDALGAEETIDFAFELGRNAVQLAGIPKELIPRLLGRSAPGSTQHLVTPGTQAHASRYDWDGAPAVSTLFGRNAEADLLRSWILDDSCRVVLITGLGGIGKSDLATCLGRGGNRSSAAADTLATGIHDRFDCVMWRSLLNAPSPEDLFADMLGFLSENHHAVGRSTERQLEGILSCLQSRRCFLILDNVETVLKPGDPALGYRDGYQHYGTFFELVAKASHQSCLLMTSREKPRAIADLEGAWKAVRSLALTGLDTKEGQSLFAQIGSFSGSDTHWSQIVKLYDGNPLALELAARHIGQVFDGDLAAFLGGGRPVFADLERLLDWHLDRLTKEETELIHWLAIEREPVTLATLRDDLASPGSGQNVASTLQSLQRRIPLERTTGHRFTLQPVLIEHVTSRLVARILSAFARARRERSPSRRRGSSGAQKLTREERKELVESLLLAFPSSDDMKQLVWIGIDENLEALAGNGPLRNVVFKLIEQTESHGTTDELILAAVDARPANPRLRTLAERRASAPPAAEQGDSSAVEILNTHALVKATAKEGVRGSQRRLILGPITERLAVRDPRDVISTLTWLLDAWRSDESREPGYLAANIIHLLANLNADLHQISFSHLPIWQACLHDVNLHDVDFSFAAFRDVAFKHPFGTVFCLCHSPSGELLAVGDDNGEVRIFSAATWQLDVRCVGHSDGVRTVAFSRDGQTLASAGFDNTIRLWNARDGKCKDVLLGHDGWVYSVAFSPNGEVLASASEDGTCRLWDLRTGRWVCPATGDPGFLAAVAFSPDSELLAVGGSAGVVSLFRVSDLEHPIRLAKHAARIRALAFSLQGDMLASGDEDGQINVWRPADGAHLATFTGHSESAHALSFSALGDLLVSGSKDRTVRLWSVVRKECVRQLHVASASVWAVDCSPAGRTFATGSEDAAVCAWDMDTGQCLTALRGYANKTWSVAFPPDPSLLLAGDEDGLVRIWERRNARIALELRGHSSRVLSVACSPDGQWAASSSDDLTVRIWDLRSGVCARVLSGHTDWIRSVSFDPGSRLLASGGEDGRIFVWDLVSGARTAVIESGMLRVFSITFCEDGNGLAAGGDTREARLFCPRTGTLRGELSGHRGRRLNALVSSGAKLATCGEDGTVKLWDLKTLECTATLMVSSKVWCGAFHGDGELFLTGSDDGMLRRWAVRSGRCEAELRAHDGPLWSLAVDAVEETVATTDSASIRLWDLRGLTPLASPNVLRPARPYEGMNVSGATGLTSAQQQALIALGAIVMPGT